MADYERIVLLKAQIDPSLPRALGRMDMGISRVQTRGVQSQFKGLNASSLSLSGGLQKVTGALSAMGPKGIAAAAAITIVTFAATALFSKLKTLGGEFLGLQRASSGLELSTNEFYAAARGLETLGISAGAAGSQISSLGAAA